MANSEQSYKFFYFTPSNMHTVTIRTERRCLRGGEFYMVFFLYDSIQLICARKNIERTYYTIIHKKIRLF